MIETLYRVQCETCTRYLPREGYTFPATTDDRRAGLFLTWSSAYDGAIRLGWSARPLLCPHCAAQAVRRAHWPKWNANEQVHDPGYPPQDGGRLSESGQGPE